LILILAAMWGASYLFIKVAVDDIPPAAMTELRVLLPGCSSSVTSSYARV
jgi:drug/metabolite transporter (DMT)-like permease